MAGTVMAVDYEVYAEGEALLGWLNSTVEVTAESAFDGNAWLADLAGDLQRRLNARGAEVAHLKMTLSPDEGLRGLAVVNPVRNDYVPELSQQLADELRAEAAPELLREAGQEAVAQSGAKQPGVKARLEHLEHFRPGKPMPTHRVTSLT